MQHLPVLLVACVVLGLSYAQANPPTQASADVSTTQTTYPPRRCILNNQGVVTLNIDFISYFNPSDTRATGRRCDPDSSCDVFFEICVSGINNTDCGLFASVTEVVASNTIISFSPDLGGETNPIRITAPAASWKGVRIDVSVWDQDPRGLLHDQMDEFSIRYTEEPGSYPAVILASGLRAEPKSRLYMIVRLFCPYPTTAVPTTTPTTIPTTTPTTTTTNPTTTTSRPITVSALDEACRSALVFNESTRLSRTYTTRSSYNNDLPLLHNKFHPWFKFGGAAGTKLLQSCPSNYRMCGAYYPIYAYNQPSIAVVGTIYSFTAYARTSSSCTYNSFPMEVVICPNNDLIYRYIGTSTSTSYGFCGSY